MWSAWLLLCAVFAIVQGQSIPPAGLYITFRDDAMLALIEDFSFQVADLANTDTNVQPISGNSGSSSYTFSSFLFDIDLEEPSVAQTAADEVTITYGIFNFLVQMDYHVCANNIPFNPCEDGWTQIFTTGNSSTLQITAKLDFSGPTFYFNATSAVLSSPPNSFGVYVQCTNAICVIPPDDIADGLYGAFPAAFEAGLLEAANAQAQQYLNQIPTTLAFPELSLNFAIKGGFGIDANNFVAYAAGEFLPDNSVTPPFSPSFVPPPAPFENPKGQIDFLVTEYALQTAIWAMDMNGEFNRTISNDDVPVDSPIHLTTTDSFFRQAVPELANLPTMGIQIITSLANISDVSLTTAGIVTYNTLYLDFVLVNVTGVYPGWKMFVDLQATATPEIGMSGPNISVAVTFGSYKINCVVLQSYVGAVSATDFDFVVQVALGTVSGGMNVTIPAPSYFTLSSPFLLVNNGFIDIGSYIQYSTSPVVETCPGGDHACPTQNTCCQWNGSYGCCVIPNAVCCPDGCCAPGTQCNDEFCILMN
eukprot:TRINITY_DN2483_c0_g1_i1.p1 TRINITY_DN2483_c0_g1~~TRINITY_DN2483_c0_g1_i1.p1  ORF type:complete len:555 (-),score=106.50 TRINITY_DN2483_c0_g1_i1:35-1633(-)